MDMGLKDKVVVITGASRGIGRSIALGFANEGARLCICARNAEGLNTTAEELRQSGCEVEAVPLDITTPEGAETLIDTAINSFGGVDALVNNVGGSVWTPFAEISDEEWMHVLNLSFMSAVRVSRAAFPLMSERGGGSIVNISSIFGRETGGPISYNASKAAMISMSSNLAIEAAAQNIRVNSVAPGSIIFPGGSWERRQKEDPDKIAKFIDDNLPFGRFGGPEEVANVVVFLSSSSGSWVTGACINVDGGQSKSNL
ncbi:MAG: SDR family NAD(P)-dependent oxidoreductase [Candidatus Latescibacterota bacterium]|nr:SDR family NAD(P)-dependent oxidoreductase [Candidatus Latescibacterota bacterium]